MTAELKGRLSWTGDIDDNGHRTWGINWLVETSSVDDGPSVVANCAGLPVAGAQWYMGNDIDGWAFCSPYMSIKQQADVTEGLWTGLWTVGQRFSTRPLQRCQTTSISDPLAEPWKVRVAFNRAQREARRDKDNVPLVSSSFEFLRGIMEDYGGAVVTLTRNEVALPLAGITALRFHVNDGPMWGLPARCVKLMGFESERNLYGTCYYYYTNSYTFECNFETWDGLAVDAGTRTLVTGGTFGNLKDYRPTSDGSTVLLDGRGRKAEQLANVAAKRAKVAKEADLFVIGVPTSF